MKTASAACIALVALLPLSEALFFPVVAPAAGAAVTIGAAELSLLTFGVIGAKVAGLAAGLLLGRAASNRRTKTYYSSRPSRTYYRRWGKRDASIDITQVLENTFVEMSEQNTAGCFQRLFCDMAADPTGYEQHVPMMTAAQAAASMKFNNGAATEVVSGLTQAMAYGESMAVYQGEARAMLCEATYNKCPYTGSQMGFAITEVEKIENAV